MCLTCTIELITGLDLSTDEGHDALEKLGRVPWPKATDEMVETAAYISAIYANDAGSTGGPLHIVVDDYNVDDESLTFCRSHIDAWGVEHASDPKGVERTRTLAGWVLDLLDTMSEIERSVTVALAHGDVSQVHGLVFMPATEVPIREDILSSHGQKIGWRWGFRTRTLRDDRPRA